jgi:hypothetical protein
MLYLWRYGSLCRTCPKKKRKQQNVSATTTEEIEFSD